MENVNSMENVNLKSIWKIVKFNSKIQLENLNQFKNPYGKCRFKIHMENINLKSI